MVGMKRSNNVHRAAITEDISRKTTSDAGIFLIILVAVFAVFVAAAFAASASATSDGFASVAARLPYLPIFGASLIVAAVIAAVVRSVRRK